MLVILSICMYVYNNIYVHITIFSTLLFQGKRLSTLIKGTS